MGSPLRLLTGTLLIASWGSLDAFTVGSRKWSLRSPTCQQKVSTELSSRRDRDETSTDDNPKQPQAEEQVIKPDILQPFLPAMDPMYKCRGEVGQDSFVVCRTGDPTDQELSNENMLKIVRIESNDLEVNTLVWKCLGYRFDEASESWVNDKVFPNWRQRYPEPPDFIGMQRTYTKEVDGPSLRSNQSLVRSIPLEFKQMLKPALKPLGFSGYKYAELTPNKTRRAQCANWLIYYRDHLFGYTVEELRERREARKKQLAEEEKAAAAKAQEEGTRDDSSEDDFKPPVREVF